jgi:adenylosuccinate lyase
MEPSQFVGRAPQQVDEFVSEIVTPIRQRYPEAAAMAAEVNV